MPRNVIIYLYDDVEVLDFAGPFEVFSTATRVKTRILPDAPRAFDVFTVGETTRPVLARGGLRVQPQYHLGNHPLIDVLIVPGGVVTSQLAHARVVEWIRGVYAGTIITASVCTGAFLLGKAGLLQGIQATTHWEDMDDLRTMFPDTQVEPHERWIEAGRIITSAGISAGLDMSLHIVSKLEGQELAELTARQMEYKGWTIGKASDHKQA